METINIYGEILAIAPYTIFKKNESLMLGDLFILRDILYYIPLQPIDTSNYNNMQKGLRVLGGGIAGGLLGAAIGAMSDSDEEDEEPQNEEEILRTVIGLAEENRKALYGLSPQERVNNTSIKGWTAIIPKASTIEIAESMGGVLTCRDARGQQFIFIIQQDTPNRPQITWALQIFGGKGADFTLKYEDEQDETNIRQTYEAQGYQVIEQQTQWILEKDNKQYAIAKDETNIRQTYEAQGYQVIEQQTQWILEKDNKQYAIAKKVGTQTKHHEVISWKMPDFGIRPGYPTPIQLVDALAKGENPTKEIIDTLANDENYMNIVSRLEKNLPKDSLDSPTYINFNLKLGIALNVQKKPNDAIKYFERVLKYNPNSVEAFIGKGDSYQTLRDSKAAERELDIAISIKPESSDAWFTKGYIYFNKGVDAIWGGQKNFEKALEYFNIAINTIPQNDVDRKERALIFQGASLYELKDYSGAINSCQEFLKLDPDVKEAWFYKGMSENKLKKYDDSEKSLRSFIAARKTYNILNKDQIEEAKDLVFDW